MLLKLLFLGVGEAIIIIVVLLLFFGATRIPVIARNLGKSIREFKDASKEEEKEKKEN